MKKLKKGEIKGKSSEPKKSKFFYIIPLILVVIISLFILWIFQYEKVPYEKIMISEHPKSLYCVNIFNNKTEKSEYVIRTKTDYEGLKSKINFDLCSNFTLPEIDFDTSSILGVYTGIPACDISYERNLKINNLLKRAVYKIEIDRSGTCKHLLMNMNWILTKKIPEDYKVTIKIIKN